MSQVETTRTVSAREALEILNESLAYYSAEPQVQPKQEAAVEGSDSWFPYYQAA